MNRDRAARQWGEPLWRTRVLATATEPVPRAIDVAIIGGGLTGISAALHLARGGLSVTVFEASAVGNGASGRCLLLRIYARS